ncbi:MAG TPA: LptF/LptG family permease [Caulobacteraceae bacterium]|nr:LptF/LptG family permease [Caulobacteraceae bacterium]
MFDAARAMGAAERRMSPAPRRMDLYVLSRTLAGVGAATAVVASIIMLTDFVDLSRNLGGRTEPGFFELAWLTLLRSPALIVQLLPFAFLFGSMGAYVALNRRSELVAMRAAGASAWRFTLPTAIAGVVIGVFTIGALQPAAASLNASFEEKRAQIAGAEHGPGEIWLRQGDENGQVVIHAQDHGIFGDEVRLERVSLFIQTAGTDGRLEFGRRIEAREARLTPGAWRLTDAREALPGQESVYAESLTLPSSLNRRTALEKFASPAAISFWSLPAVIEAASLAGYATAVYRLRLDQLLATPLVFAAMTIVAGAFSFRLMRLGGLARMAIAGAVIGFVLYFLDKFCGALGSTGVIPPLLAAWATPALALLAGVSLLCWTEDG